MAMLNRSERIKLVKSAYGFAFVMAGIAIAPGLNFAYSGHGGVAWFLLPFVFPVALFRLRRAVRAAPPERRAPVLQFAILSVIAYAPLSFAAAYLGALSIRHSFGLDVDPIQFWGMFTLPFGLVFSWRFFT